MSHLPRGPDGPDPGEEGAAINAGPWAAAAVLVIAVVLASGAVG